MTDGLKALAGDAVRGVLMRFTRSPVSGAVTGAVGTALLQSSSATTVAAVGFVGAGLITFPSALGVVFGEAKGSIVGAAGLLPALSKLHGLKGVCLMGETHGGYVDTASARSIVQLLSKYLGVPISLKKLDERVAESQKVIKKVEEDIQKSMSEQFEATNKNVSYIR